MKKVVIIGIFAIILFILIGWFLLYNQFKKPGLPKGPYYNIDEEVYSAVAKPARVSELSRIVIDVWNEKLLGIREINDEFEIHKNIY